MNEFKDFFCKFKKLFLLFLVIVLMTTIIGPFIVNLLFKLVAPHEMFVAEWSAEAALEYYGAILTFLGTSMLSGLALWQNHIIKEENDKHTELLDRIEEQKNSPYFIIEYVSSLANYSELEFNVKNMTANMALNVEINNFCIVDKNGDEVWKSSKRFTKDSLHHCSTCNIQLQNKVLKSDEYYLLFNIVFFDVLNRKQVYQIRSLLKDNTICCLENNRIETLVC